MFSVVSIRSFVLGLAITPLLETCPRVLQICIVSNLSNYMGIEYQAQSHSWTWRSQICLLLLQTAVCPLILMIRWTALNVPCVVSFVPFVRKFITLLFLFLTKIPNNLFRQLSRRMLTERRNYYSRGSLSGLYAVYLGVVRHHFLLLLYPYIALVFYG